MKKLLFIVSSIVILTTIVIVNTLAATKFTNLAYDINGGFDSQSTWKKNTSDVTFTMSSSIMNVSGTRNSGAFNVYNKLSGSNYDAGDILYFGYKYKTLAGHSPRSFSFRTAYPSDNMEAGPTGYTTIASLSNKDSQDWTNGGATFTIPAGVNYEKYENNLYFSFYTTHNTTSNSTQYQTDDLVIFNLTDIFGSGNEPTANTFLKGYYNDFDNLNTYNSIYNFSDDLAPNFDNLSEAYTIAQGESFNPLLQGVTAYDYIDGDRTSSITATINNKANLDTSTLGIGKYPIKYTVCDTKDNCNMIVRYLHIGTIPEIIFKQDYNVEPKATNLDITTDDLNDVDRVVLTIENYQSGDMIYKNGCTNIDVESNISQGTFIFNNVGNGSRDLFSCIDYVSQEENTKNITISFIKENRNIIYNLSNNTYYEFVPSTDRYNDINIDSLTYNGISASFASSNESALNKFSESGYTNSGVVHGSDSATGYFVKYPSPISTTDNVDIKQYKFTTEYNNQAPFNIPNFITPRFEDVNSAFKSNTQLVVNWADTYDPDLGDSFKYILEVQVNNGVWKKIYEGNDSDYSYTTPNTAGHTTVKFRVNAKDNHNNYAKAITSERIVIDNVAPIAPTVTTIEIDNSDANYTHGTWSNSTLFFEVTSLESDDLYTSVDEMTHQYSLDNGATWKNSSSGYLSSTTEKTILFRAIDKAGNISETISKDFKIDKSLPSFRLANKLRKSLSIYFNVNDSINHYLDLTTNVTDLHSGLGSNVVTYEFTDNTGKVTNLIPEDRPGTYTFKARLVDVAGNEKVLTRTIHIVSSGEEDIVWNSYNVNWNNTAIDMSFYIMDLVSRKAITGTHDFYYTTMNSSDCSTSTGYVPGNSFITDGITEGIYKFCAKAVDKNDNTNSLYKAATVKFDFVKPIIDSWRIYDYISKTNVYSTEGLVTDFTSGVFKPVLTSHDDDSHNTGLDISGLYRQYVSLDGGNTWCYTNDCAPLTIYETTDIMVKQVDNAGNESDTITITLSVDTQPPTTPDIVFKDQDGNDLGLRDIYGEAGDLNIEFENTTDNNTFVYEYSLNGTDWITGTPPKYLDKGVYTLYYRAIDAAGNVSETNQVIFEVDRSDVEPANYKVKDVNYADYNVGEWTNDWVQLSFEPGDYDYNEYSLDGGLTWIKSQYVLFESDVNVDLQYRTVGRSGRKSPVQVVEIRVDTTKPDFELIEKSDVYLPVGQEYTELGVRIPTDSTSGICEANNEDCVIISNDLDINTPGKYTVTYSLTDVAGNTRVRKRTITVWEDYMIKANLSTISGKDYLSGDTINQGVNFNLETLGIPENATNIQYYYSINGGEWVNSTNGLIDENGSHTVDVKVNFDVNNDESIRESVDVFYVHIEDAPPTVELTLLDDYLQEYSLGTWSNTNIYYEVTSQDGNIIEVSFDEGLTWSTTPTGFLSDGIYLITYKATDSFGVSTETYTKKIKVDTKAPIISFDNIQTIEYSTLDSLESLYSVIDNNDLGDISLISNLDIVEVTTDIDFNKLGNYDVLITARDYAGNVNTYSKELSIVDTIAPTISTSKSVYDLDITGGDFDIYAEIFDLFTANDNYDGDITNELLIDTYSYDFSEEGSYDVLLTAIDSSGNTTYKTITVNTYVLGSLALHAEDIYIELNGDLSSKIDASITIAEYNEEGQESVDLKSSVTYNDTKVDLTTTGIYPMTYTLENNGEIVTKDINVYVYETISSTIDIELYTNTNIYILFDQEFGIDLDGYFINTVIDSDSFNTNTAGASYIVNYTATSNGVLNYYNLTINVNDTTTPVLVETGLPKVIPIDDSNPPTIIPFKDYFELEDNGGLVPITEEMITVPVFDRTTPGTIIIEFDYTDEGGNTIHEEIEFEIIDNTSPELDIYEEVIYIEVNSLSEFDFSNYFKLRDNFVDITNLEDYITTDLDLSELGTYNAYLFYQDSSKNNVEGNLTIHVVDTIAPVIEIINHIEVKNGKGFDIIDYIILSDNYVSEGYLIEHIAIPETTSLNNYESTEVTLWVSDSSGNISIAKIKVTVSQDYIPFMIMGGIGAIGALGLFVFKPHKRIKSLGKGE